jgi:hypothetical protein
MNIISYLKPLAHAEKEALLKQKKHLFIAYDENENWVESFAQRGFQVLYAKFQLSTSFFEYGESDTILAYLKHIQSYKVKYLIATLPTAILVTKDTVEHINIKLNMLIKMASKYKIKVIIEPTSQTYKSLVYILKAFKPNQLQFLFNPAMIYKTKGSVISLYRVFKSFIQVVVADDLTKELTPALIGYGEAQLISLFKAMVKDSYQGDIVLDPKFEDYLSQLEKKKRSMFSFLSKKHIVSYDQLKKQMRLEEKKDIHIYDIYQNQYDVLHIIFRLG